MSVTPSSNDYRQEPPSQDRHVDPSPATRVPVAADPDGSFANDDRPGPTNRDTLDQQSPAGSEVGAGSRADNNASPIGPNRDTAAGQADRQVDPSSTTRLPAVTGHTAGDSDPLLLGVERDLVVTRQRDRFGGMKIGSAFFGWLTATGMAVLLISLLAAAGVAFGLASSTTVDQAVRESESATGAAQTVGLVGAITLLVILFAAYFCGGYVAGRMARFDGFRQGLAVWLWGVFIALLVAAFAAIAGAQYDVLAQLNLPRIPVNEGEVTMVGVIAVSAAVLTALIGALLGGLAGMRFHRKVDAEGFPSG